MEIILENDILKVTITTRGAQAKSVVRKEDGVEHIWCGDPQIWEFHTPILFPYCSQLKDKKLEARGQVAENCPGHGFYRNTEHTLVKSDETSVVLALTDNEETRALWPYSFRLVTTFTLEGDTLHHTLTVENTDTEDISFGIGYHPAFALPFDQEHTAEDYEIRFDSLETPLCRIFNEEGLVTDKSFYMGTNIRSKAIDKKTFSIGSYVMTGLQSRTVGLFEKDTNRGVVCGVRGFPYVVLWAKPDMLPPFVCIEPWHSLSTPADGSSKWEEKPHAATIAPGQDWSTTLSMSFVR